MRRTGSHGRNACVARVTMDGHPGLARSRDSVAQCPQGEAQERRVLASRLRRAGVRDSGESMPQFRRRSQAIEFSKFPQQRLDARLAPLHEAPLEPPAILSRTAVRGSIAMILIRFEAR